MTPVAYVAYCGPLSQLVAEAVAERVGVQCVYRNDCDGLDKNLGVLLYDTPSCGRRGSMTNQGVKLKTEFAYSVAIYRIIRIEDFVTQICSDYFTNFSRNSCLWGFPWGFASKSYRRSPWSDLLRGAGIIRPPSEYVTKWYTLAQGGVSHVFIMLCPDYPTELHAGVKRYTIAGELGSGIGVVAERSLSFLSKFSEYSKVHDLDVRVLLGVADYEDYSDNLARLNETASSFAAKIGGSIAAISSACSDFDLPITVFGIRSYFGRALWERESAISAAVLRSAFNNLTPKQYEQLILRRSKLYSKWYPDITPSQVLERCVFHGVEYANCGYLFSTQFENLLILGTNSLDMSLEYSSRNPNLALQYITSVY